VLDVSDGIIEGLLGEVARLRRVIHNLVVEDGEVECQTKADRVRRLELLVGEIRGLLVGTKGALSSLLVNIARGVLGNVSVVVTLHLQEEDLGLSVGSALDEEVVEEVEDVVAEAGQLSLDLLLVVTQQADVLGALRVLLLLDGGDGAPGRAARADRVLVGDGQEVALLNREVLLDLDNLLHVVEHILEALRLLGDLGHVDEFFSGRHFC
jgi:hypothetical protein